VQAKVKSKSGVGRHDDDDEWKRHFFGDDEAKAPQERLEELFKGELERDMDGYDIAHR